eukprot:10058420-Alexandrium_andersonii.AAC.1
MSCQDDSGEATGSGQPTHVGGEASRAELSRPSLRKSTRRTSQSRAPLQEELSRRLRRGH